MQNGGLQKDPYGGEHNEKQRCDLDSFMWLWGAALLFSIGFCFLYNFVFQSDNSFTRGIVLLLGAWPAVCLGVFVFVTGVLGWHL
jgi:hypothetical protein